MPNATPRFCASWARRAARRCRYLSRWVASALHLPGERMHPIMWFDLPPVAQAADCAGDRSQFCIRKRGPNVGARCAGVLGEKGEDAILYEQARSPMRRIQIIVSLLRFPPGIAGAGESSGATVRPKLPLMRVASRMHQHIEKPPFAGPAEGLLSKCPPIRRLLKVTKGRF